MSIEDQIRKSHPDLTTAQVNLISKKVRERLRSGKGVGGAFFSNLVDKVKAGVKGLVSSAKEKVKEVAGKVVEKGLDKLADVANANCKDPNPAWEYKPKPGEKHQVFLVKGCTYRARFSGPGSHAIETIKELINKHNGSITEAFKESNFPSKIDLTAAAHDLRYILSGGNKDLIRKADIIFIKDLEKQTDPNRLVPLAAMKAKVAAEDYKLTEVYGSEAANLTDADRKIAEQVLRHLERRGYGYEIGVLEFGKDPKLPTSYKTGPVGYPIIKARFPSDNPAYPVGYLDNFYDLYPQPELGVNPNPRPLRTEPYSVKERFSSINGRGQDTLYQFPTIEQQESLPFPQGFYQDGQFTNTNEEGPYSTVGIPRKDTLNYPAPPINAQELQYSVPIGRSSVRKSYTGEGRKRGGGPTITTADATLLTGNGRKHKPKRRSAGGSPWVDHVKAVQKEKGISYKAAMTEAKKTYKK